MVYLASTAGSYLNLVITFHVNCDHKSRQNFRDCLCPIRTCGQDIESNLSPSLPKSYVVRQTLYLKHTSN